MKLYHKATTTTSTCISFLLLVVSLLSPTWLEIIVPKTDMTPNPVVYKLCNNVACSQLEGTSDTFKASRILLILTTIAGFIAAFSLLISCHCLRCYGRPPNMLVSSAASFAAGVLGFVAMTLYTMDATQKEMDSMGSHLHFTWSFCLTWMVFSLFIINGFFSLLAYLLCAAPVVHRHTSPFLLGRRRHQSISGDFPPVRLSVLPSQEEVLATPGTSHFPGNSICFSSTVI
ncbi:hypothetical protein JRQ81_011584 [Phrynocephalus forsythii]|uniref:Uncharacterized protein n=1 Tax=Phrynocephalus forsythii TaxID=171643 RepID=A0A9Q1AQP4_9SAUR|nr:hypothetical protein JRQ81_011584 [Phrynocephalus forsythii]